ncbi:hypothetical protein F511_33846 [Dorcoceras hygrometricum]|uniref:Dystroglycan-like n=1 Tax=Dorcoceras hygrometricum TaxID=472368 RepID=A0A2Z7BHR3_9LAMI|nr:hypothetical protein F511_33846 [Dorcoceras hygrometricum]
MASSLFVNTLQVDFTSVLTMEHAGMVRMFKTLEDTGLRGFLEGTTPIFESAVVEFFLNARVIAGTIVSTVFGQKLVVTEEIFSETFKLPTEGMQNFSGIPNETIAEMRTKFSDSTVPFQSSWHDILAKSLCAKAGSFDKVTCEKFEVMVAISAGLSVNWGRILFQRLLAMVQNPRKQSQGFTVQINILMELLRQHTPSGWPSTTQPDPISALTTAPEEFPDEQILQRGGVDNFADNLDLYDQTAQDEPSNQIINVDHPHQIVPTEGEGDNADDEQWDHGSQDPTTLDINLSEEGKGKVNLDDDLNNDARTEHERQPEPDYIADASESRLHDSIPIIPVTHEGNVVYQHTANSPQKPDDVVQIQVAQEGGNPEMVEDYCTWLIMTAREKLLETELEKLYLEHLANFKTNVVSAHRDFECIRRLHQELRLIAAAHRHHGGLVGLQFTTLECDFLPKFSPALEIYNLTALNTEAIPRAEQDVSPHQDPDFSNLQLVATAPQESSTLQLLHTANQSLNSISTHVSSLDQSYVRLRDDTNITRHHTTKLRDELKSTAEGFDIRIDVLERTLTQRMVDELAVVKSQLAVIVEDLKESSAAKKGEGGSSSRTSGRGRGGSSSQGFWHHQKGGNCWDINSRSLVMKYLKRKRTRKRDHSKVSRTGQDLSSSTEKSARSVEVKVKPARRYISNKLNDVKRKKPARLSEPAGY